MSEIPTYQFTPVAVMHSCFRTKFGIPRQPGLVPEATGEIEFVPPYNQPNVVRELEGFSHIWVLFVFDKSIREHWKATVRPPRLGGDKRVGVFASRSPFRPNPIGLSVVKLKEVVCRNGRVYLRVDGVDLLDGTPILDVKPYIPFCDSVPEAVGGYVTGIPEASLEVVFSEEAEAACARLSQKEPTIRDMIVKLVQTNPRPAYQDEPGREYGIFIHDWEAVFTVDGHRAIIVRINE